MVMYTLTAVDIVGHVAEWLRRGLQIVCSGSTQHSITQRLSQ